MDEKDVLKHVTGDWQEAKVIAMNAGMVPRDAVSLLMKLECKGEVESMFDKEIHVRYWRLNQGGFRPASELVKK